MRVTHHPEQDREVRIDVEGLSGPLRIYQFSDTHLQAVSETDPDLPASWRKDPQPELPRPSAELLQEHLDRAESLQADLILMVGDLFHFPSPENVSLAARCFSQTSIPLWIVPGNHDWFYPGMDGWEPLRAQLLPRLQALFSFGDAHAWSRRLADLRIIGLDNSTYYLDETQADFLEQELAKGDPSILLLHIPLSTPEIRPAVLEKFTSPLLMWDPAVDHAAHRRPGVDLVATERAVSCIRSSTNLLAVLAAHVHLPLSSPISAHAMQYISGAGYRGEYRVVALAPLG